MRPTQGTFKLLDAVLVTGVGAANAIPYGPTGRFPQTYHAKVVGTGALTATVLVEVSNDGLVWNTLGTITLSGTTSASDGFASNGSWAFARGNVTAVTGTGAAVSLVMSV